MLCQDLTPDLAPTQHPCMQPHCTPTSLPPTPLYLIAISVLPPSAHPHLPIHHFLGQYISPRLCVDFFVKGAHSMGLFHIHTTHSINNHKHPTPTRLGQVYKRALVEAHFSPYPGVFVCGVCAGTAQIGNLLVSLFDSLFKQSRLHCADICLT